ncbi:MBL fold metallo-hydrolase [Roseomonas sp. CECT 9278]|uniref:MBL fold metallo-hydrolase n=1 Tax=Roseomonas sp. CECT 9278 TaxID=2845823 RepID=UPI001E34C491|nr:MBL fold metallo-hydrolase [Roseomonas sp. CECT 9278]CAH0133982.1 Hydroxyacylglutathione hydrolase GloC [Roseomonas sp. CECT 9278]
MLQATIILVTPFQQNCTLVWDQATKQGVVVDPGGDAERIQDAIQQAGVQVQRILLTHGHLDHAGAATELARALGVPIEGPHRADAFLLDSLPEQGAKYGMACRAVTPDRWLNEGDSVEIAGQDFSVLHCPGHTPGHVVFVNVALGIALVGDVLFQGSVGRTDFPYGDTQALISAIRTKLFPLGDDIQFICGHGPGSTFGDERRSNPYAGEGAA